MHGSRRLQINVRIRETFVLYPHLRDVTFPLCWTDLV